MAARVLGTEAIVSYCNSELQINELSVCNFRKFESFGVAFDPRLTVLVGDNGSGKSTVIDAACVVLGPLLEKVENGSSLQIVPDDARRIVLEQSGMADVQPQFPVEVSASGLVGGEQMSWSRSLNGPKTKTTRKGAENIRSHGEELQKRVSNGETGAVLPILVRYGTDRLWQQGGTLADAEPNRTQGYADALHASSNESRMNAWFKRQSLWEWQNKRESSLFCAVKKALATCFDSAASVSDAMVDYDAELQQLVFAYHDGSGVYHRDRLHSMSDGYRGTLSLIADIAYRMATLNPAMGADVLSTPGVVMIDEVDLHLHPRWQARVLGDLVSIFPNVQFIVSTHAPVVVSSVPKANVRVLGEASAVAPATETRGRDASDILNTVLGASSRPGDAAKLFAAFDAGDEAIRHDLQVNLGLNSPRTNLCANRAAAMREIERVVAAKIRHRGIDGDRSAKAALCRKALDFYEGQTGKKDEYLGAKLYKARKLVTKFET